MPSNAYKLHLLVLLQDAGELEAAHRRLRTGAVGRQWGLGALNRAVIVSSVSAWEAYLEAVILEVIDAARPRGATGVWAIWRASASTAIRRFHNPDPDNAVTLLRDCLGLQDVRVHWRWRNCTSTSARSRLKAALRLRHEVAHGVNPRPIIHNHYAQRLPGFFRRIGTCTDTAIKSHASAVLGLPPPW